MYAVKKAMKLFCQIYKLRVKLKYAIFQKNMGRS